MKIAKCKNLIPMEDMSFLILHFDICIFHFAMSDRV